MSCVIDYTDHYSHFDPSISAYHFLRYSDRHWRLYNPALHYQSRLRHPDYFSLADAVGLEVVDVERHQGWKSLPDEERRRLAGRFAGYADDDLLVTEGRVVLRSRPSG